MRKQLLVADDWSQIQVGYWEDVEPVIEANKRLQKEEQRGEGFRHIADIPIIILNKWMNEEWERGNPIQTTKEMDEVIRKKLADPDWKYLRTDGTAHRTGYNGCMA